MPIQYLEQFGAHLAKSAFYVRSSSRSFGWVKIFSVGPCSINQIEKGDIVGKSICLLAIVTFSDVINGLA